MIIKRILTDLYEVQVINDVYTVHKTDHWSVCCSALSIYETFDSLEDAFEYIAYINMI